VEEALAAIISKGKTILHHLKFNERGRRCIKQRFVYDSGGFGKTSQILPGATARPQDETGANISCLDTSELILNRNRECSDTLVQA
jgi:hypothetical protein